MATGKQRRYRPAIVETTERMLLKQAEPKLEQWRAFLDAPGAPALTDPIERYQMALMLDSASQALPSMEATQSTSVFGTNYIKAFLGMTRQIFPRLVGTRLVAVQPLDRPTGLIFALNLTRDDGSTLGLQPYDDASAWTYSTYTQSQTYADHSAGEGGQIATGMALNIQQRTVSVGTPKKLLTSASMELIQDLNAYYALSALDLLQGAAVDEIAQELDAMMLSACRAAAIAHYTVTFGQIAPTGWAGANDPWRKRLQRAILLADAAIYRSSRRHPNVMVVGVDAYTELLDLAGFVKIGR